MSKVIIAGCGAAGMMAAISAARKGKQVTVYEKNDRAGRKLFITGKGRCNITNAADLDELFSVVVTNRKFLYSSFYSFTNTQTIDFFEKLGVKTKIERGGRVFPLSDHSSDVINALVREMKRLGVNLCFNTEVKNIIVENGKACGVRLASGEKKYSDAVIIATGGISYPSTGSTGDGYRFAGKCGHQITDLSPALVPFEVKEWYARELMGLSLRNIEVTITEGKKTLYKEFGEMLFTHYGVSGPVILSASSIVGNRLKENPLVLHIDLKPALTKEQLDKRVLRDFSEYKNRQFKNSLDKLFPSKLIPVILELSGIPENKKVNEITKEERSTFIQLIKDFSMTLVSLRGYNEAIITRGGVCVKEIDPGTMQSKLVENLYFAGEVLDLDAVTGGYNLQIAWSTGYLAGNSAGE